jgi:hypothetical protein
VTFVSFFSELKQIDALFAVLFNFIFGGTNIEAKLEE